MQVTDLVLVSVGNTRTRISRCRAVDEGAIEPSRVVENSDAAGLLEAVAEHCAEAMRGGDDHGAEAARILVASVNDAVADRLVGDLQAHGRLPRVVRLRVEGGGEAIPMQTLLEKPLTVGADRLLAALAAHSRSRTACVVIDAGTAVTVDFVDAYGVFHGGVIAPGLGMMLRSLKEGTAALPQVPPPRGTGEIPEGPAGRSTRDAMVLGCVQAVRGLAHRMIDLYAEASGRYPRVVATGGDAPLLFESDELVEVIVPDLVLLGMREAWGISRGERAAAGGPVGDDGETDLEDEEVEDGADDDGMPGAAGGPGGDDDL